MKKHLQRHLLFSWLIMMTAVQVCLAQDFAVINSANILSELPETQQMRSNLQAYQNQLQKQGERMVNTYKSIESDAVRKEEAGQLAPLEKERILKELEQKQKEILAFEKEMQQKLIEKEQQYLSPILDRVNQAIKELTKEKGLKMILDSSTGAVLYVDQAIDLTADLKRKLGI